MTVTVTVAFPPVIVTDPPVLKSALFPPVDAPATTKLPTLAVLFFVVVLIVMILTLHVFIEPTPFVEIVQVRFCANAAPGSSVAASIVPVAIAAPIFCFIVILFTSLRISRIFVTAKRLRDS